jgi:predicted nucleotidyltransferase component of viral defense system
MNWVESKALTPLKRDFLKGFFSRNQAFFLTGGSALGIFYLQHRLSYDLDLFTTQTVDWHALGNQVRAVADEIGAECRSLSASPDFHRHQLQRGAERELLDFVIERVPQVDSTKSSFDQIRVDTLREILVNKICALIHRCEMKDLIDLYFLHRRGYRILDHFDEATKKEGGLDPAMISFLLSRVKIELPDYLLEPVDLADFESFVRDLRRQMAAKVFPKQEE